RRVFGSVAGGADVPERVALHNGAAGRHGVVVVIHVRVVVHNAALGVDRVHTDAAEGAVRHAQDLAVVRGEDRRAARRQDVERMVRALAAIAVFDGDRGAGRAPALSGVG